MRRRDYLVWAAFMLAAWAALMALIVLDTPLM